MNKPIERDRILVGMPSLHSVRSFVAAAKYQNFTRAAESLCVTQAAISRQIRELEDFLGTELFTRHARSIDLTDSGQMFFDAAYMSFVNISQAAERIRADGNSCVELCVGASPAFSSLWLAPRLPQFLESNPDICINVMTTDEFSKFETGSGPSVFISMNQALYRNYSSIRLFSEKIYPVCSPEFIRLHPEVVTLQGLRQGVLVELSPFRMSQIYEHLDWNSWFYLAGLQPTLKTADASPPCRANDYNVVLEMAMGHQGIALGWDHLVRPLLNQGRLVRPVPEEVVLKEKAHYLFYGADIANDSAFLAFKNWLITHFDSYNE